jgi:hypothetical protein
MHACMQLSAVKEACCGYLLETLDEGAAARTLSLAAKYSCEELLGRAAAFASGRFHAMRPDALAECGRPLFGGLVGRDDLSVHSELQAREACAWYSSPAEARPQHLGQLHAYFLSQTYVA